MTMSRTGPCTPFTRPQMIFTFDAALEGDLGDLASLHIPVAGIHHLVGGGQVGPELESPHASLGVALGHLLVDDAAARGHPLDVARGDDALVPHAVPVLHVPLENVGDRLDPPMRVPGESWQVFRWVVRAEIVEQQEGVEEGDLLVAEGPFEVDARPFDRRPGSPHFPDGSEDRHRHTSMEIPAPCRRVGWISSRMQGYALLREYRPEGTSGSNVPADAWCRIVRMSKRHTRVSARIRKLPEVRRTLLSVTEKSLRRFLCERKPFSMGCVPFFHWCLRVWHWPTITRSKSPKRMGLGSFSPIRKA